MQELVVLEEKIRAFKGKGLPDARLVQAKKDGFADRYLASLLDAGGNIFYLLAKQYSRMDIAVVLSSMYPAVTVLLASRMLKEKVSGAQWLGVALCICAIALIASGTAPVDDAVPSMAFKAPTSGIAFNSDRDGYSEIYRIQPDGSGLIRLTDADAVDAAPDWSPDGTRLAFRSRRSGRPGVPRMSAPGNNFTPSPAAALVPATKAQTLDTRAVVSFNGQPLAEIGKPVNRIF